MADAVFRVAADVAEYIAGMTRADAANKKVAKSAAGIGDAVGRSVVKIELLNRAINAAGRAISNVMDKASSTAATAGERATGLAVDLSGMGVSNINEITKLIGRGGATGTTAEQGAQFVRSLAQANKDRRAPMKPSESEAAIAAFMEGGEFRFGRGGEELIRGLSEGRSLDKIMRDTESRANLSRLALMDPMSGAFQNMRGNLATNQAVAAEEGALLVSGTSEITERANMRVRSARDPGGAVSIAQGYLGDSAATIVNRGLNATAGFDAAAEATNRAANQTAQMVREYRKAATAPSFATETR